MNSNKITAVPKDQETLISNIANVIKGAKKEETIMCNVDIEDCLVKGKIGINNIEIDEGVLGVLELIKKEAEKKRVNFIMNFNSVAPFNNLYVEKKDLLARLYNLNQDKTINRITVDSSTVVRDGTKNQYDECPVVMEEFIFGKPIDDEDDYENKKQSINYSNILKDGKLKKNIANELYLEDFRKETNNTKKVYVFHFDNEVSYFDDQYQYKDQASQFFPVPINCAAYEYTDSTGKTKTGHQQKIEGAFLSTNVLVGLRSRLARIRRQEQLRQEQKILDARQRGQYEVNWLIKQQNDIYVTSQILAEHGDKLLTLANQLAFCEQNNSSFLKNQKEEIIKEINQIKATQITNQDKLKKIINTKMPQNIIPGEDPKYQKTMQNIAKEYLNGDKIPDKELFDFFMYIKIKYGTKNSKNISTDEKLIFCKCIESIHGTELPIYQYEHNKYNQYIQELKNIIIRHNINGSNKYRILNDGTFDEAYKTITLNDLIKTLIIDQNKSTGHYY